MYEVWCEENQHKFSNNQELRNMVQVVNQDMESRRVDGVELFFLTDHSVADAE